MSASCRVRVSVSRSTGETLCRRRRRGPRCAGTPGDAGGRRCAYCATAVPPGAVPALLCRPRGPRVVTYVIAEPCVDVKDKACIDECPVDCIYEGERMLYIQPDECVDCGACEPVCPVEAIFYEDDVPEQWSEYYRANVEFFDVLGSPGGAAKRGEIDHGHPIIAALPPQIPAV